MSRRQTLVPAIIALCALAACSGSDRDLMWTGTVDTLENGTIIVSNPSTGVWDLTTGWRLEENLRIGAAMGEVHESFSAISDIEVDAAGSIYVLDRDAQDIRVFEPDGRFVRTVGRKGQGPGEFRRAYGMALDHTGNLWVVDDGNLRYSVFDTTGVLAESFRRDLRRRARTWKGEFLVSGGLYDQTAMRIDDQTSDVIFRFDSTLGFADTLFLPRYEVDTYLFTGRRGSTIARFIFPIPFIAEQHWALDPRGVVWIGTSERFRLHRLTLSGDTTLIVERSYAPVPVTDLERGEALQPYAALEGMSGNADPDRIPDYKPAFTSLTIDDDGNVWVFPSMPADQEGAAIDVFSPDGRYLGQVWTSVTLERWPRPLVRRGSLYGVTEDELEVAYVVRLLIGR